MKNLLKLGFMAIVLSLFFGAIAKTNEVKAQGAVKIANLYQLMENNRTTMLSLKSSLAMNKNNSQTGEDDLKSGNLVYLPTAKAEKTLIRIEWLKPKKETIIINKGVYAAAVEDLKVVYRGKVDRKTKAIKTNGALDFLGMSSEQMRNVYDPKLISESETLDDGTEVFHLKLTPKSKSDYKYAEVWVDGKGVPLQGRIVEKNNDSTTVTIGSNYERNFRPNKDFLSKNFDSKFEGYKTIEQ